MVVFNYKARDNCGLGSSFLEKDLEVPWIKPQDHCFGVTDHHAGVCWTGQKAQLGSAQDHVREVSFWLLQKEPSVSFISCKRA